MAQPVEPERIDTLLALSVAFGQSVFESDEQAHDAGDANATTSYGLFDALNDAARHTPQLAPVAHAPARGAKSPSSTKRQAKTQSDARQAEAWDSAEPPPQL